MTKISTSDIIFESRADAETALDRMEEIAELYGQVTLMDLKDLAGLACMYADNKCYWTTEMLKHAAVYRVRDGWNINLTAPIKENENANEASAARYPEYRKTKTEPKLVFITINTEEVENVDDVLDSTFKFIATFPDREIHLTIT